MRLQAIIRHVIIYTIFAAVFVLGFLNTTWIYLNCYKSEMQIDFISNFIISTVYDYFVYEIIIISAKALVFYSIIGSEKISCWKKTLIGCIAALPWVINIIYNYNNIFLTFRSLQFMAKENKILFFNNLVFLFSIC